MLKRILLGFIYIGCFSFSALANQGLLVYGQGAVAAEPDSLEFQLVVEQRGKLASKIKTSIDSKTKQIVKILQDHEVQPHQIQSMLLQIQPVYKRGNNYEQELEQKGFIASRTINVTLSQLENYDLILDKVLRVGTTQIQGLSYQVSNHAELYRKALNIALRDATVKASEISDTANRKLGEVIQIKELSHYAAPAMEMRMMSTSAKASMPGLIKVQAKLEVEFDFQ